MTGPWQSSDYRDSYADRVNELLEAKKNDEGFQPAGEAPPGTTVVDLTEAPRASVAAAKTKKTPGGKRVGRGKAKKKTGQAEPARKTRSRKPAAKERSGKAARRSARKQAA
jgi:DNA end-binding protein Ku